MAQIRTFIAVPVSQRLCSNATQLMSRLAECGAVYNWVEEENLHITLNFVGDMPEIETPKFCNDVKAVVEKHRKFGVMVTGLSAFPNPTQPRVIWLGITEGADALKQLNRDVAELLSHWGFPKERHDYEPHITLGRVQRGGRWTDGLVESVERYANHDTGWFQASEVVVYSSFLDRSGPTYTPMSRIRLK